MARPNARSPGRSRPRTPVDWDAVAEVTLPGLQPGRVDALAAGADLDGLDLDGLGFGDLAADRLTLLDRNGRA